jgi:hypothetical protein
MNWKDLEQKRSRHGITELNWTVSTATSSQYLAVNCEPIV